MSDTPGFGTLVPGFEFLQGLVKNAGAALPGIGQWVAPTIDPAELEKRIDELRTVQFWLEQNARMLGTTIQALEVQRMTLSTLKTMNVQMEGLRDSLKIKAPPGTAAPAAAATPTAPVAEMDPAPAAVEAAPGVVDPMQWWGALTKQFTEIANTAIKEGAKRTPAAAAEVSAAAHAKAAAQTKGKGKVGAKTVKAQPVARKKAGVRAR